MRATVGFVIAMAALQGSAATVAWGQHRDAAASKGLAHTFSVKQFGATGDGWTDDSVAIGKTVEAARAAGGVVLLPCGDYRVDAPIVLAQTPGGRAPGGRAILYLSGLKGVTLRGEGACSYLHSGVLNVSTLEVIDSERVVVEKMRVAALNGLYVEKMGLAGGSAIKLSNCKHCEVSHVEVTGAAAEAIYLTNGTSETRVHDNLIEGTSETAIDEDNCGAVSSKTCEPYPVPHDNQIVDNTLLDNGMISGFAQIGIDDGTARSNTLVARNRIKSDKGVGSHEVSCINVNNGNGVIVRDNVCEGSPGVGVAVAASAERVVIAHNIITRPGQQCLVAYWQGTGVQTGVTFADNTCVEPDNYGIYAYTTREPAGKVSGMRITGNHIVKAKAAAIYVQAGDSVTVEGNMVDGAGLTPSAVRLGVAVTNTKPGTNTMTGTAAAVEDLRHVQR